jgi:hypothetical protein
MNGAVGDPQIGQWYERTDNGGIFQVIGFDDGARTVEIQSFNGDIDELEAEMWASLPLVLAQPPEDWLESMDDLQAEDVACSEAETLLEDPAALERFVAALGDVA